MTDPDYRALCAELVDALGPKVVGKDGYGPIAALLPRARAALAQTKPVAPDELYFDIEAGHVAAWRHNACAALDAQPEPAPTDEEIMELMPQQMRDDLATAARALAGFDRAPDKAVAAFRIILNRQAVKHARAVLARWGTPANNTGGTQYDG